jgi:hypothetical protein
MIPPVTSQRRFQRHRPYPPKPRRRRVRPTSNTMSSAVGAEDVSPARKGWETSTQGSERRRCDTSTSRCLARVRPSGLACCFRDQQIVAALDPAA